ncbi:sigma-54 dependent transcriptional regulator [Brevibacillus humidisoli]|uniref:sigma-54-dependent transcriptional regulator n=1 Tax=Brevibacillus humidisoli TaxID=2895522 RepID=UPI001E444D13|nr:sigma-54 dependent transcriptional regulator [Brevibacillus humidisoli]UFJ41105.1 sigma-54 dependent transcriptional regulator [Brevibacillus humidisoli]
MGVKRILIVDDEMTLRLALQAGLEDHGCQVETAENIKQANAIIKDFLPHIMFLDIRLPDGNGLDLLEKIRESHPDIAVVMMTAYGDTRSAVRAIKSGAVDYINKPFELEEVQLLVEKTFKQMDLESEVELYRQAKKNQEVSFIGESKATLDFIRVLEQVAVAKDTTVLIRGETGTGKELAARYIHEASDRQDRPFLAINCGALPSNLIESELFGHEKGAFTGANQTKKGLFEWADGGTLFLDEIGELAPEMQVKLLRFLEERKFKRVGGFRDIVVDVRVIAATHRDLEQMVVEKAFRSDLYYRLNVVPITLPPLHQRGKDIVLLADYFLKQYCQQMGRKPLQLTDAVKDTLLRYTWPGNIRELKNIMERIAILQKERFVQIEDLPKELIRLDQKAISDSLTLEEPAGNAGQLADEVDARFSGQAVYLEEILEQIERTYILKALEQTRWNISQAAKLLGMSRYACQRRVDKYFPQK